MWFNRVKYFKTNKFQKEKNMATKKTDQPLSSKEKEMEIIENWRLLFKWLFIFGALSRGGLADKIIRDAGRLNGLRGQSAIRAGKE